MYTSWSTLHEVHFMKYTSWSTLHEVHFMMYTSWRTLHEVHFMKYTSCSTLHDVHSMKYTSWSTLHEAHFMKYTSWSTLHEVHFMKSAPVFLSYLHCTSLIVIYLLTISGNREVMLLDDEPLVDPGETIQQVVVSKYLSIFYPRFLMRQDHTKSETQSHKKKSTFVFDFHKQYLPY